MAEPTFTGAECGASDKHLWYKVIVRSATGTESASLMEDMIDYILINCSHGEWVYDWSNPKTQESHFLFEKEEDAAMFRMRFC